MTDDRMEFREDLATASDYLRMAVPLMVQREIPPTPYNYALWYAHVRNTNPELSTALLARFPGPGSYDPDRSEALFFEYFVRNYLPNHPQAQHLLVSIVSQLAKTVSKNLKTTQQYGGALKEAMDLFEVALDRQTIQDTLTQLLAETATVESLNQEFQIELEAARVEVERLRRELQQSQRSARLDSLTKIPNRRAFDDALLQSLSMTDEATCLLLLDLDHFKRFNDSYGHLTGDRILVIMGEILAGLQGESIFVARYGGEEFCVIVNDSLQAAGEIAETIRRKVSAIQLKNRQTQAVIGAVSVSIGVVQAHAEETPDGLIGRADAALYRAKNGGRNRVVLEGHPGAGGAP